METTCCSRCYRRAAQVIVTITPGGPVPFNGGPADWMRPPSQTQPPSDGGAQGLGTAGEPGDAGAPEEGVLPGSDL